MKTHILLALAVMAAGCAQRERTGPQFGDNPPGVISEAPLLREARLRNEANPGGITPPMPNLIPTPVIEPFNGGAQPVVVTGNAPLTTISRDAFGGTSVVNYGVPAFTRPVAPPYYYGY